MTGVRAGRRRAPRAIRPLVLVAVALAVTACTPTFSTSADTTTTLVPPPRTVLRIGVEEWPECLNPLLCADGAAGEQIFQHVLPGAYRLDDTNDYRPTGVLASPAEIEEHRGDGGETMTIRYRINPEARWADGKPITSSDFLGTWRAVMTTPGADTAGYSLITGVDDRDPLTAVVTLAAPYGEWRELFGGARNHLLQADAFGATTDLTGLFDDELPFAGGPFQLLSWSESEAVLARVDNDWDPDRTAATDQVRLRPIRIGEVSPDSFDILVPSGSERAAPPSGYDVFETPTTRVLGVWLDQRDPTLQVLAHRRFVQFGLDTTALAEGADDVTATAGPVPCAGWAPGLGPWCELASSEAVVDPARARATLAAEGWSLAPEGTLVRNGEVFSLTVTWDPADAGAAAVAAELSAVLADYGVTVATANVPTSRWRAPRGLDTSTGVGVYTIDLGVGPASGIYTCAAGPESSILAWCPQANLDASARLAVVTDEDEAARIVEAIGRRAVAEAAWLPVTQLSDVLYARDERVALPELTRAVGGPLAHLAEFEVAS